MLELTFKVADQPITTSVIVMVRRADHYKHVPVVGDMKYNESEGQSPNLVAGLCTFGSVTRLFT